MDHQHDIGEFRESVFRTKNVLNFLLAHARKLMKARQVGLVYGSDPSGEHFLPPGQWDRGIMDRFNGQGAFGILLKYMGPLWVKLTGNSPVHLYDRNELGEKVPARGIIAYTLRNHREFYEKGVKILLVEILDRERSDPTERNWGDDGFSKSQIPLSMVSYDGHAFSPLKGIMADTRIIKRFRARNFIAAYIPDYGAIVFNTVQEGELAEKDGGFIYEAPLKSRLDHLILAIEIASLVYLGHAKGDAAAKLIWRKESRLRQTAAALELKQKEILEREEHLMSVGGVTLEQLAMEPAQIHDGVYAFVDMVGSVGISRSLLPRDYVFLLNLCHEIAAETARVFGCRVDNFIGDAVFFQSLSIFDDPGEAVTGPGGRLMRMTCLLASVMGQIHDLANGDHPLDREKRISGFLHSDRELTLGFRAGMSHGSALVGPLGSRKRKIITAIGETVDLASRLESSGKIHHIHMTSHTAGILREAWVSNETPLVFGFANRVLGGNPAVTGKPGFPFLKFYRSWLGLKKDLIKGNPDASYKEFSLSDTCLLPCLAEHKPLSFCSGI